MVPGEKMTPAKEDYLKTILELSGCSEGGIRSVDIAEALGVSKASVSNMTGILRKEGYVEKKKYGTVTLTESGRKAAEEIKRRCDLIEEYLNKVLGVEAATATADACRIEHIISSETVHQIDKKLKKLFG
ncbi:MAG: metal-dependent transcriptional regulator [Clostridiales bacterium]|jgi:DtxR family Mn-dependent transcriptional regulator|nr:metal-dependent transcriptional regulator [Clostridiales bacterium]